MSSYSRIIFFIFFLSSSFSFGQSQTSEDLFIMVALDSETQQNPHNSAEYYEALYKKTSQEEYLKKAIFYNFQAKKFAQMEHLSKNAQKEFSQEKEYYMQQEIIALLSQNKIDQALIIAKILLKKHPNAKNYEIIANIFYLKKNYQDALQYYESAYVINQNEKTLLKLTSILYTYLNQKDIALAYLETFLQTQKCTKAVCDQLLLIYQEQGNVDGMLSILNRIYLKYKQNPELQKTTMLIQNLIVTLLEMKDIKEAIAYLEKTNIDQAKLINLYYQDGQLHKALKMTRKLYKETKKPELLGKIAMYEFELAKDKQKVLKHVIANFELALSSGINDASYQNYYGYLLIDFNIDVQKGVDLVKSALRTSPNNVAYLDSLAWGYYKLGKCTQALDIMQKVIAVTGLEDLEIKLHWNMIQNCTEGK